MFYYIVFSEVLHSDEIGQYISFGIQVQDANGHVIISISDVSTDQSFVSNICDECNSGALDPVHLMDIIEDRL